jgi:stage II sporulation protein D
MDLSPVKQLRNAVCRAIAAGACLLCLCSEVEAAQSIRVLLSADVSQLDIRGEGALWVADIKGHGQAMRASIQVAVAGTGFLMNGVRMQTEQLTLHGGERGLTLTFPRPVRRPSGSAILSGDSGTEISLSGIVHLVRRGKGFLVINRVDLEEYVKGVVPAEVSSAWHPEMLKAQAVAARTYAL